MVAAELPIQTCLRLSDQPCSPAPEQTDFLNCSWLVQSWQRGSTLLLLDHQLMLRTYRKTVYSTAQVQPGTSAAWGYRATKAGLSNRNTPALPMVSVSAPPSPDWISSPHIPSPQHSLKNIFPCIHIKCGTAWRNCKHTKPCIFHLYSMQWGDFWLTK